MRKLLFLYFVLNTSVLSFAENDNKIGKDHWSYQSLEYISNKKILKENLDRFDGTQNVTKAEFVYSLAQLLKLVETQKASQADIRVLESLILQYSDELNKIGFDTKTFDQKLANSYDNMKILQEKLNENEKKIDFLLKRVEKLENKK